MSGMKSLNQAQDNAPNQARVEVRVGADALAEMDNDHFFATWKQLYQDCSWATAGQNPEFLKIWYRLYASLQTPVLVFQWAHPSSENPNELRGVLALCRSSEGLQHAASEDCEYHAWIAQKNATPSFMPDALDALLQTFGPTSLRLNYLPPDTPLQWLKSTSASVLRCELGQTERRVLPVHDPELVKKYLRNKSRLRTTMNKFKRTGDIQFRRASDPQEAIAAIRAAQPLFDFRKGALYGVFPFRDEPLRSDLLEAQAQVPDLLHVSVLERNQEVIAAHIGTSGKKELSIAGLVHSEFYSRYSPGSLLLVELISSLHEEGYSFLDFTPGDDEYKARFAKDIEPVYTLHVYPSRLAREATRFREQLKATAKSSLKRLPEPLQGKLRSIRSELKERLGARFKGTSLAGEHNEVGTSNSMFKTTPLRLYRWHYNDGIENQELSIREHDWKKNNISDLLRYPGKREDLLAMVQLAFSLARAGAQMFTQGDADGLHAIYFLVPAPSFSSSEQLEKEDWILWGLACGSSQCASSLAKSRLELVTLALECIEDKSLLLAAPKTRGQLTSEWENHGIRASPVFDCECRFNVSRFAAIGM